MPCKSEFSLERFKIVTIFVLEDSRQRSLIFLSQTKSPATKKTGLKQFNPSWCSRKSISINPLPIFGTLHSQSCHSARRELRVKTGLFCCFYATEWRRRTSCELHITSTNRIGPPPAHPPPAQIWCRCRRRDSLWIIYMPAVSVDRLWRPSLAHCNS